MDPTLAALIGAGFGALVTALSPWLTERIQHRSRRREMMRKAYLDGMRVVANLADVANLEDLRKVRNQLLNARMRIRLVGSGHTSSRFGDFTLAAESMDYGG